MVFPLQKMDPYQGGFLLPLYRIPLLFRQGRRDQDLSLIFLKFGRYELARQYLPNSHGSNHTTYSILRMDLYRTLCQKLHGALEGGTGTAAGKQTTTEKTKRSSDERYRGNTHRRTQ